MTLLTIALASVPDTVRPIAAPADAPSQHAAWAREAGRAASPLVCQALWPDEAMVCFTVVEGETRRWVTEADLKAWSVDRARLIAVVIARSEGPTAERPRPAHVEGGPEVYWVAAEGDGWDAALLLRPERLAMRVGGEPVLVAVPTTDTVLAWRPGTPELDKIMAVGARRLFDGAEGAVSPVVHRWADGRWTAFGEAVASPP